DEVAADAIDPPDLRHVVEYGQGARARSGARKARRATPDRARGVPSDLDVLEGGARALSRARQELDHGRAADHLDHGSVLDLAPDVEELPEGGVDEHDAVARVEH